MARGSSRDVTLTLSVDTLGEEGIKSLEDAVRSLAQQGGTAGPKFQTLADEIARLGQQNTALQTLKGLADETGRLQARQEETAASVSRLANAYAEQKSAIDAAKQKQADASAEVIRARQALDEATLALRQNKTGYDEAGNQIEGYKAKTASLLAKQTEAKQSLDQQKEALKQANKEVADASVGFGKLETALTRAKSSADSANDALARNQAELKSSAQAANQLGLATDNIAEAEGKLLAALNASGAAAGKLVADTRNLVIAQQQSEEASRAAAAAHELAAQAIQEEFNFIQSATAAQAAFTRAIEEQAAAQKQAAAAAAAQAAAAAEMEEHNRLLAIQQRAQNELLQRGADALQAETTALREATQASNVYEASKTRQVQAEREAADAARQAAQAIDNAFKTIGVRSVQDLQREIQQVRDAMVVAANQARTTGTVMSGAFAAGEAKIRDLERQIRELNGTLTTGDKIASLFKNSLGQIAAGNIVADAVGYLVNKVKELGAAFVSTIAQTEQMRRGLTAIYGDIGTVAKQMSFLRTVALDSGVSIGSLQQNFVKFSAAMNGANVPLQQSNELFEAVSKAAGTLGLSGDQVTGMLEALGQMASKGTVSLEELRQQLGDRLPAAMSLSAKGLGITQEQLIKLVSSGSLATKDFIGPFTNALRSMAGEVSGITPTFENLKTALTTTAQVAGDSGWTEILTLGLRGLALAVGTVVIPLQGLFEIMSLLARGAGVLAGAIFTLTNPMEALGELLDKSATRMSTLTDAFDRAIGFTDANTQATGANAQANAANATAMAKAAAQADAVVASLSKGATAASDSARANEVASLSAQQLAAQYLQLNIKIQEQLGLLEKKIEAAEKEAKAVAITGQAMTSLVALRGNERDALQQGLQAAEANIAALEKSQGLREQEVAILATQRKELQLLIAKEGEQNNTRQLELDAINKKLAVAGAELEQSKAAVLAAQNEATARTLAAKAYEDNSAALETFRDAAAAARANLDALSSSSDKSLASQQRLMEAQRQASIAIGLYVDALKDKIELTKSTSAAEQARYSLLNAGLEVEQRALEMQQASARASGDFVGAINLEIAAKGKQIEQINATMDAKRREGEALLEALKIEREELEATGKLTAAKQQELSAREANALQKIKESEAGASMVAALQREQAALTIHVEAVKAASTVEQARYNLRLTSLGIEKQYLEAQAATARASGDIVRATQLEIQAKEVQIRITALSSDAKFKEAEATIRGAEAEYEQLRLSGQLTEAKQAEIEARILNAQAKMEEARAGQIVIDSLNAEIGRLKDLQATKNSGSSKSGNSSGGSTGSGGGSGGGFNSGGALGQTLPAPRSDGPWTWVPMPNQGYDYGGYWINDKGKKYFGTKTGTPSDGQSVLNRFLGQPNFGISRTLFPSTDVPTPYDGSSIAGLPSGATQQTPSAAPAPAPSAAPTNVTINLAGRTLGKVGVANTDEANKLASILSQIETAKGTSS